MSSQSNQRGLGLVELMISIAIGLLIMAGVIQLFATSTQNSISNEASSRIQENIRYVMRRIGDDIELAGNMGCLSFASAIEDETVGGETNNVANATLSGSPVTSRYINNELAVFNSGLNSWNDFQASFISGIFDDGNSDMDGDGNNYNNADVIDGTDTLIIKYADTRTTFVEQVNATAVGQLTLANNVTLAANTVVMAGGCNGMYVFSLPSLVDNNNVVTLPAGVSGLDIANGNSVINLYHGNTGGHEYQIRDSSVANSDCSNNAAQCSLYRVSNGDAKELTIGVDQLQLEYANNDSTWREINHAALNLRTIDRVRVTLRFSAVDTTQNNNILSRTITRVFALRNQL